MDTQRLREAAEWLIRLSGDALDDQEFAAWIAWYEADLANALAFKAMQDLWGDLGQIEKHKQKLAAEKKSSLSVSHGMGTALRGVFESLYLLRNSYCRGGAWVGVVGAGTVAAWIFAMFVLTSPAILPGSGKLGTHLTQNQEAVLPDGSTLTLGAQSSVSLEYVPKARQLKLTKGQAFFNVAKDKSRPFTVDAGELKVRAVGTAFDIRKNEGRVVVTVTEGTVDILENESAFDSSTDDALVVNAPIRVNAGYQLIWDGGFAEHGQAKKIQLAQVDTASTTAWREGCLEYFDEPLSVVIANVNRYSSRRLVAESPDLGKLLFTGTILVNSIDDWLVAIQRIFPVSVEKRADGALIIRLRPENTNHITLTSK